MKDRRQTASTDEQSERSNRSITEMSTQTCYKNINKTIQNSTNQDTAHW